MISAKKIGEGKRQIEITGNNLEVIEDLLALIDAVTKVVFKDSDRDKREFLNDIPYLTIRGSRAQQRNTQNSQTKACASPQAT